MYSWTKSFQSCKANLHVHLYISEYKRFVFIEEAVGLDPEMSPKFVKGQKKYGRRSKPDARGDMDNTMTDVSDADFTLSFGSKPGRHKRSLSYDSAEVCLQHDVN